MKRLLSEAIGTFFLVFAGTGAIVVDDISHGQITHLGVAMTFGLVVMILIYAFGGISGAHFNPVVTLGFWLSQRFETKRVLPYLGSQFLGGVAASGLVYVLFPNHQTLGATLPIGSSIQSFVLEVVLTLLLVLVILNVTSGSKEEGLLAGVAIGGTVGLEALFAGPICGASMNPVRSFAPALISGQMSGIWIYLLGPLLGSCFAVVVHRVLKP